MGRFYGVIGYSETKETTAGVWEEVFTERKYSGDVLKNTRRWQSGDKLNDDLTISNTISIVADPFAFQNFHAIKYVNWMGASWKVVEIDANQRPRLLLTIGGVYNGK